MPDPKPAERVYSRERGLKLLMRVEKRLWRSLQKFPDMDWQDAEAYNSRSQEHKNAEEAWECIYQIRQHFFLGGSSHGSHEDWPFRGNSCHKCGSPADSLVNSLRDGDFLPDAPRFLCHKHYYELSTGKKYASPTKEETLRSMAMSAAISRMIEEIPPKSLKLDCGLTVDSFTMMDGPYLKRLLKVAEEEYAILCQKPN